MLPPTLFLCLRKQDHRRNPALINNGDIMPTEAEQILLKRIQNGPLLGAAYRGDNSGIDPLPALRDRKGFDSTLSLELQNGILDVAVNCCVVHGDKFFQRDNYHYVADKLNKSK